MLQENFYSEAQNQQEGPRSTFRLLSVMILYRILIIKEKSSSPGSGECMTTNDYCEETRVSDKHSQPRS